MSLKSVSFILDRDPSSPREMDNVGTIACLDLRRYSFGEEIIHGSIKEFVKGLEKGSVVLPLYMQDHGDIALRTTPFRPNDEPIGVVYATPASIINMHLTCDAKTRRMAKVGMQAELEEYVKYINGECYGISKIYDDGSDDDTVFGFYGANVFENGMSGDFTDEELPILMQAVAQSDFMEATAAQLENDMAERLARKMESARAASRPRRR